MRDSTVVPAHRSQGFGLLSGRKAATALLALIVGSSFFCRLALNSLQVPLQGGMGLNDNQVALVLGAAEVPLDVVVVNPTHYAVALRYDDKLDAAPVVVAKGVDEQAEKIREIARQNSVPVLSRPPLARALHKHVKEGRAVPANLYRAVAEVLAYVYRLRQRGSR